MASRKRKEGESFKDYRKAIKRKAYEDKVFLKGNLIWMSSSLSSIGVLVGRTFRRDRDSLRNA